MAASADPPLLAQKAIRGGKTVYGKCTASNGNVTCTNVKIANLTLPKSFATSGHTVKVHAVALPIFKKVVAAIDAAGLGKTIKTFSTYYPRQCKDARTYKFIPGCISIHSWGLAVDVNNPAKPSKRLLTIFTKYGFYWGGLFQSNPDVPHFQYTKDAS